MKLLLFLGAASLLACSPDTAESTDDHAPTAARDLCFLQVTGHGPADSLRGPVDTLRAHLHIEGDRVSGELSWLPAEKDRLTGTLAGTLAGGRITAIHTYSAEGTTAREQKIMRIDADGLHIKSGELEEHEGIWMLKDTATAPWGTAIPAVACR